MKIRFLLLPILLMTSHSVSAQEVSWLFENFTRAEIEFKNRTKNKADINIDMSTQRLCFLQEGVLMEMTNVSAIKKIRVADRSFVMKEDLICEEILSEGDTVYVNWAVRNSNLGSRGAYGLPTHGQVQVLNGLDLDASYSVSRIGKYEAPGLYSKDIWTQRNDNTYFFRMDGREYRVKNLKTLYNLFPDRKTELKIYTKENALTMSSAEDALKIISFMRGNAE